METPAIGGISYQRETSSKPPQSLGQEDFLKLMITQFQNQDPFKPMESGEFLGQMAQFSTVAGINDLNSQFAQLAVNLGSDQALQGAALVGRQALVEANAVNTGEGAAGIVELDAPGELTIDIHDASGQLVRSLSLGPQTAGASVFTWDGAANDGTRLPAGDYRLDARLSGDGVTVSQPILITGRIDSVSVGGNGGTAFNIAGIGPVSLGDIRRIN